MDNIRQGLNPILTQVYDNHYLERQKSTVKYSTMYLFSSFMKNFSQLHEKIPSFRDKIHASENTALQNISSFESICSLFSLAIFPFHIHGF
jgi:hypothetical protein